LGSLRSSLPRKIPAYAAAKGAGRGTAIQIPVLIFIGSFDELGPEGSGDPCAQKQIKIPKKFSTPIGGSVLEVFEFRWSSTAEDLLHKTEISKDLL